MKKIVLVFDIDDTLHNFSIRGKIIWHGDKALWLEICSRLQLFAKKYDVEFYVAIATSKSGIDTRVIDAVIALKDYLYAKERSTGRLAPIMHAENAIYVHKNGQDLIAYTDSNQEDVNPNFLSSIQVTRGLKSRSLKNIARVYGIDVQDYDQIFIVDDRKTVCEEANAHGFQSFHADNLSHADKDSETQRVQQLLETIENSIQAKIKAIGRSIHQLVHQQKNTEIEYLLQKGLWSVNALDENGRAAIEFAVEHKDPATLKLLLIYGASIPASLGATMYKQGNVYLSLFLENVQNTSFEAKLDWLFTKLKQYGEKAKSNYQPRHFSTKACKYAKIVQAIFSTTAYKNKTSFENLEEYIVFQSDLILRSSHLQKLKPNDELASILRIAAEITDPTEESAAALAKGFAFDEDNVDYVGDFEHCVLS